MAASATVYFDRYARGLRTEPIYGEKWLRFAYENPAGRLALWLGVKRAWFSRWYGRKMNRPASGLKVLPFISKYGIDVDEFEKSAFDFKTFNEFFFRALRPESRPIAAGEGVAVLPADGRHLAFPDVDAAGGFYVKGAKFSVAELLGEPPDGPTASKFAGGAMLISRLCPTDYHRFHFPVGGVPGESRPIRGFLYSVHPVALRRNIRYLVSNKREVTLIESPAFGTVAMAEVGATNVGSIKQSYVPGRPVAKGAEKGFFAFGGSCVVTLFQRGRIRFDADLVEQGAKQIETYARMGDRLGVAT
ncbi:MAG TPA: archaetidylserine decarboxylase [Opitutaceae bacterium]|nr:archaetidylserine decarboxylase [Opitutaceae bacterium]